MEKIKIDEETGCWMWQGRLCQGYGRMMINRQYHRVHRLSYEAFRGPIPDGLVVRHTCDTPACIYPLHLKSGTTKQNIHDAIERKRFRPRGKDHLLSEVEIKEIARRYHAGESTKDMGQEFGLNRNYIMRLINQEYWRELGIDSINSRFGGHLCKLTEEQVREIRQLAAENYGLRALGRKYGVAYITISNIVHGRKRKSVK